MGKFSPNNGKFIVLGIAALFMTACLEPVNIDEFLRDERVLDIIEKNQGKVTLVNNTNDDLEEGFKRISGLDPNKYYMVEILDEYRESFDPRKIWFVNEEGSLKNSFNQIHRVTGGIIKGLNNDHIYAVYSAPITGNMNLYEQANSPPPFGAAVTVTANTEGLITPSLPAPNDSYYLDFPAVISTGSDILRFPVVPLANPNPINFLTGRIIRLEGADTTTDYVFYDANSAEPLRFLRVVIDAEIPDLTIIVQFLTITDMMPNIGDINFSQSELSAVSPTPQRIITISNANIFDTGSIEWYYSGYKLGEGSPFILDFDAYYSYNYGLNAEGMHLLVVEAKIGGTPYSAIITVTVTQ